MILNRLGDMMSKRLILFIVLNMLIIVGCLMSGFYFYNRAKQYFASDITYIAPLLNENHLHFNMAQVETLERAFYDTTIVAKSRGSALVSASMQAATTRIIFSNSSYFAVHALDFIEGGHWHGIESSNSIVINQALAWRLFGATEDIVGLPIWMEEQVFTVTGVVRQTSDDRYLAWMPAGSSPADMPVTALYILSHDYNPLMPYMAQDAIRRHINRNPNDYAIVNINRFIESMNIRNQMLLSIIWVIILVYLVRWAWRLVESGRIKAFKDFKGLLLPLVGISLCVYALWGINDILMWLPNLSNPNTSLFTSISTVGILPPEGYLSYGLLRLGRLSRYVNYAFIAGLAGLFNVIFCLHFNKESEHENL